MGCIFIRIRRSGKGNLLLSGVRHTPNGWQEGVMGKQHVHSTVLAGIETKEIISSYHLLSVFDR